MLARLGHFITPCWLRGRQVSAARLGVHYVDGYTNVVHLAPAFAGDALFVSSLLLEIAGLRLMAATREAAA